MNDFYKVVFKYGLKFAWLFGPCLFYVSELFRYLVHGYTLYIPFSITPDWVFVFVWNTSTIWVWGVWQHMYKVFQQPKEKEIVYEPTK
jgi:hypothetical protein